MEYVAYIVHNREGRTEWELTFATKSDASLYLDNMLFASDSFTGYYGVIEERPSGQQWLVGRKSVVLDDWRKEGF